MRIRKKEIRKLHKRREERYKALNKKPVTPTASTATGPSVRAGAGGRTSTGGAASGGARAAGASASRPPRRPAGPPTEG